MKTLDNLIAEFRSFLNRSFLDYDKVWIDRQRKMSSEVMFSSIFSHVLAKDSTNTNLMFSTLQSLCNSNLPSFSASAYSKARKRFPFEFFVDICQWLYKFCVPHVDRRWFGYSIFAIDSMKFAVPKELEIEGFDSMNDQDSYYPQAMLTAAYDLQVGMIYDSIVSQHGDERSNAYQLFDSMPDDSMVICDRGFPSFDFFYNAEKRGIKLLVRIGKEHAPSELREFIESESHDEILTLTPSIPSERKAIRHEFVPRPIEVRAVKYQIKSATFIIITTALEDEITYKDIGNLYHARWDIEEAFKLNKVGLKLEDFKSKHLHGVLQEIWATQAVTCLCRALAICTSGLIEKNSDRIQHSMLGIVKILRANLFQILTGSGDQLRARVEILKRGIMRAKVKFRPNRSYDRKSRKRPNRWTLNVEGVSC